MNTPELNNQARPRVAILGVTGMIGSAIYGVLKDTCSLIIIYRDQAKLDLLYRRYGRSADCIALPIDFSDWYSDYRAGFAGESWSPSMREFHRVLSQCDWVINAMGVTKAIAHVDPANTLFINGAVPHILAAMFSDKLVHITTDCVFDGMAGAPYDEDSLKRPVDLYGLSKSIGEPTNALILRVSTIGPELGTNYGLLEWFFSQTDSVKGFTNHLWNGLTSHELGRVCLKLVTGLIAHPGVGIYHIFSKALTKADMLEIFKKRFGSQVVIDRIAAEVAVDRRLGSQKPLCQQLSIPAFNDMLSEVECPVRPELVEPILTIN